MISKKVQLVSIQVFVCVCCLVFCFLLSYAADVTLTVGNGSGLPGSNENPVVVSLDNPNDRIKGIEVAICDTDDYLSCTECVTTERASDLACLVNEVSEPDESTYRCCKVILSSLTGGGLIETGAGPVFTLIHDVSEEAPEGECRNLNTEELNIADENLDPLEVTSEPGEFCFSTSSTTTTTITTTTTTANTTPSISISPDPMWKSRWISLPYLMVIAGNNTHFKSFNTRLSFKPPLAVFPCFPIIWNDIYIWDLIWVMPGWLAGLEDQTVTVTVTTGDEIVEDDFEVKLLPFILTQNLQSTTSAHKKPFLK